MMRFLQAMAAAIGRVFSDPGARATMVLSILVYFVLYPQPYRAELVRDVPVAVVDQNGTVASRALIRGIDTAESAAVVAAVDDLTAARQLFFARKVYGIVIIPPNFERDLLNGEVAPIAAFGDAAYFLIYSSMMGAISGAARSQGAAVQIGRLTATGMDPAVANAVVSPVTITSVALFNPQGGYASYIVPAAFVLIIQQTLLMGIGILHAGRKPADGIEIFATPLAYILYYCVLIAITQILLPIAYDIPRLGAWWHIYVVAVPFLLAVCAMGFAVAQLIPWREGMVFFFVVLGLPLFFLSGISWPLESLPTPILQIAQLIPSTTAISAFVQVDQMGAGLAAVTDKILLQLALAVGYTLLALVLHWLRAQRFWPA